MKKSKIFLLITIFIFILYPGSVFAWAGTYNYEVTRLSVDTVNKTAHIEGWAIVNGKDSGLYTTNWQKESKFDDKYHNVYYNGYCTYSTMPYYSLKTIRDENNKLVDVRRSSTPEANTGSGKHSDTWTYGFSLNVRRCNANFNGQIAANAVKTSNQTWRSVSLTYNQADKNYYANWVYGGVFMWNMPRRGNDSDRIPAKNNNCYEDVGFQFDIDLTKLTPNQEYCFELVVNYPRSYKDSNSTYAGGQISIPLKKVVYNNSANVDSAYLKNTTKKVEIIIGNGWAWKTPGNMSEKGPEENVYRGQQYDVLETYYDSTHGYTWYKIQVTIKDPDNPNKTKKVYRWVPSSWVHSEVETGITTFKITEEACYANTDNIETASAADWLAGPSGSLTNKLTVSRDDCRVDDAGKECYGNGTTYANSTAYSWRQAPNSTYKTLLANIKSSGDCGACFGDADTLDTSTKADWRRKASTEHGYTKKLNGVSKTDCTKNYACYADNANITLANKADWRLNSTTTYPIKIASIKSADDCTVFACYADTTNIATATNANWQQGASGVYTNRLANVSEDDCKVVEPAVVTTCKPSITTQSEVAKTANTCNANIQFSSGNSFGDACTTTTNSKFYNIVCEEKNGQMVFMTDADGLVTTNSSINYRFTYSADIICKGTFNETYFKDTYNKIISNLNLRNLTDEQRIDYQGKKNDLENQLKFYNDWVSNFSYNMDKTVVSIRADKSGREMTLQGSAMGTSNRVYNKTRNINLQIAGLTNPADFDFSIKISRNYTMPKAYYNNIKREVVYEECSTCVPLENKYYIENNNVRNNQVKYVIVADKFGYDNKWMGTVNCTLDIDTLKSDAIIYRTIDENEPFIEERPTGDNWVNDKFDFRQIIKTEEELGDIAPLYEFNLSKDNIKAIRKNNADNGGVSAYIGEVCARDEEHNEHSVCEYSAFIRNEKYFTKTIINDKLSVN